MAMAMMRMRTRTRMNIERMKRDMVQKARMPMTWAMT